MALSLPLYQIYDLSERREREKKSKITTTTIILIARKEIHTYHHYCETICKAIAYKRRTNGKTEKQQFN